MTRLCVGIISFSLPYTNATLIFWKTLLHWQYQDQIAIVLLLSDFFLSRRDFILKSEITRWEANLIS